MLLKLLPFADKHIAAAAQLLAARQQRDRCVLPMLPQKFEDLATAKDAIETAWAKPWSSGAVAMLDGSMVGYLLGSPRFDQHLGRTVWVRPAGYALAEGVDVELIRDLYAAAGPAWLEMGCFDHYAMISLANRAMLDAWYSLSFGQQQGYGICTLANVEEDTLLSKPANVTIRQANQNDATNLEALCYITGEHQFHAPTWAPTPLEIMAGRPENYRGVAADDDATTWLALRANDSGEEAVGFQVYYEAEPEPDDLYIPESCIELSAAGTDASAREAGIGQALANAGFNHAREEGYSYCLTDWRTTNLQASRFWPRRGFKPVLYRLHRRVNERIMWANKAERAA